ncbi:MAG: DUF2236 domain-containing protein [Chloroflexi bacterium]|nr:MAG: DUF2236 domain-containing protein [Chloroflexota bacterium]
MPTRSRDDGYFPRDRSVLRRVQEERAVGMLYGQRALLIGALQPLNYLGTVSHDLGNRLPYQRLAHTGKIFETVFFGTRAEADRVLRYSAAVHTGVRGGIPEAAGPWRAGAAYSATDPALMLWTIACMADSALALHEALVRRLSDDEREGLWSDYLRFGELFEMPRAAAPATFAGFREYWRERLGSAELFLVDHARRFAPKVSFELPLPTALQPGYAMLNLLMLGTVPAAVRRRYGLGWSPAHELVFRSLAAALRNGRIALPGGVRRGGNTGLFDLIIRTEREQVRQGRGPLPIILSSPGNAPVTPG